MVGIERTGTGRRYVGFRPGAVHLDGAPRLRCRIAAETQGQRGHTGHCGRGRGLDALRHHLGGVAQTMQEADLHQDEGGRNGPEFTLELSVERAHEMGAQQ